MALRKLAGAPIFLRYRSNAFASNQSAAAAIGIRNLSVTEPAADAESEQESPHPLPENSTSGPRRAFTERPLENGLDTGVHKAILVGQVGQPPLQKKLKSGNSVTLISVGTGGIRNNRRPLDNEDPKDYANRCAVQWHRVSIHPERLGELAMKNIVPGSIIYVEGNIETKIFNDPITGLVRRIREVAVRRNGRILFLGNGGEAGNLDRANLSGIGYY